MFIKLALRIRRRKLSFYISDLHATYSWLSICIQVYKGWNANYHYRIKYIYILLRKLISESTFSSDGEKRPACALMARDSLHIQENKTAFIERSTDDRPDQDRLTFTDSRSSQSLISSSRVASYQDLRTSETIQWKKKRYAPTDYWDFCHRFLPSGARLLLLRNCF